MGFDLFLCMYCFVLLVLARGDDSVQQTARMSWNEGEEDRLGSFSLSLEVTVECLYFRNP